MYFFEGNIFEVEALKNPVTATIEIPGSKSHTNRALVMAALTKGVVTLHNPLYSEDTEVMISCLRTLGLQIETASDQIIVYDEISTIPNKFSELFVKDSGTTLRFLSALLCLTSGTQVIKGNTRLNERPIKGLIDALRFLGAKIEYLEKEGQPPLKIHPSLCTKNEVSIDASMSSQFLSALLLIAPFLNGVTIHPINGVLSKPYVDMTIHGMHEWGIEISQGEKGEYFIPAGQSYQKKSYYIEGDYSSAGYFFAIAALTKSTITLNNLNPSSVQADRKFLDILASMGNKITMHEQAITIYGKGTIPLTINMEDCPDQVQTLAVLAAFSKGITKISGVRSLRLKETERVQALKNELAKMGIHAEDTHDTLTIYGGEPRGATIDTYGDHRMAMAFAVAVKKLPGMKICHPEVVNKTFPTFWDQLQLL